jgi:hypothetical protein
VEFLEDEEAFRNRFSSLVDDGSCENVKLLVGFRIGTRGQKIVDVD